MDVEDNLVKKTGFAEEIFPSADLTDLEQRAPHISQQQSAPLSSTNSENLMARRGAPPHSGPAYISHRPTNAHPRVDPNEGSFSKFLREQIYAPEKFQGNVSIVTGVGLFLGGILVVRTWGELMVPA